MSNEVLAIIISVIIMVPATVLSLFSNGKPRNLNKKNEKDKT